MSRQLDFETTPPRAAAVRPRVATSVSGDVLPLEEAIDAVAGHSGGIIEVVGEPGFGKTTALIHLAAILPKSQPVQLVDDYDGTGSLSEENPDRLVIYTSRRPIASVAQVSLRLAVWSDDELIEYLLSVHPDRCRSVMRRLRAAGDCQVARGIPEIWRIALDAMARDDSIVDVRDALRKALAASFPSTKIVDWARSYCQFSLIAAERKKSRAERRFEKLQESAVPPWTLRALRHRPVQILLAADAIAEDLESGHQCTVLKQRLPRNLVCEIAALAAVSGSMLQSLRNYLIPLLKSYHSMAASVLHHSQTGWSPGPRRPLNLSGAYLEKAAWSNTVLTGVNLTDTNLTDADLTGSTLEACEAVGICLRGCRARGASLARFFAPGSDLTDADFSASQAARASFSQSRLERTNFEGADLCGASFHGANLTGARFSRAELRGANLHEAIIAGADFTDADLRSANLRQLPLSSATLSGARFAGAQLSQCDLEFVELARAEFRSARLVSTLLTGSRMPGANFSNANLRHAGLAEVEWEHANLQNADLTGATFHMGSSRSGLVGSPLASEGTRTGFYTDDYDEQDFKSPEEIRKANLCGADLRGARVTETDFYLVDLRGAVYTPAQADHFRRCGAILRDPQ